MYSQANTHLISKKEVTKIKNMPKWTMLKEVSKWPIMKKCLSDLRWMCASWKVSRWIYAGQGEPK